MLAQRVLFMRPALSVPAQVRTISLARIALEPAKKFVPPPPPPPPAKKPAAKATTTTKTTVTTTTIKAAPKATTAAAKKTAVPATRVTSRLTAGATTTKKLTPTEKEKAREKERAAKEKEKLREQKARAKEREVEKKVLAKERETIKAEKREAISKPYPPPPKRPMSGYFLFARDPNAKRQKGENVSTDAMFAGEAWKALTEAEREVYNRKAEVARAQWKLGVAKWVSSLNLAQLTAARFNREPGTRAESSFDTLPKRPGNAYSFFLAEVFHRPDLRDKIDAQALKESGGDDLKAKRLRIGLTGRTAGGLWRTMSDSEKEVYLNKSVDAKKVWQKNYGHLLTSQKEAIVAAVHP